MKEAIVLGILFLHFFIACSQGTLLDGLVLWLPLNGDFIDACSSPHSISGSQISWINPSCDNNISKSSAHWSGSSYLMFERQYVLLPLESTKAFTLAVWVNFSSSTSPLLSAQNNDWGWYTFGDVMYFQYSTSSIYYATSPKISNNIWHHYAVSSVGGTRLNFYVDGTEIKTEAITSSVFSSSGGWAYIGELVSNSVFLTGSMEDFRIYNRALSSNEISQLASMCPIPEIHSSSPEITEMHSSSEIAAPKIESSSGPTQQPISSSIIYHKQSSSNEKSTDSITDSRSSISTSETKLDYIVIIIEFDKVITDTEGLKNEIATILGIDNSFIEIIVISSHEVQVTITDNSIADIIDSVNRLLVQINNGEITNGLLRDAIDAWIRGDNSNQLSTSPKHSQNIFICITMTLLSFFYKLIIE